MPFDLRVGHRRSGELGRVLRERLRAGVRLRAAVGVLISEIAHRVPQLVDRDVRRGAVPAGVGAQVGAGVAGAAILVRVGNREDLIDLRRVAGILEGLERSDAQQPLDAVAPVGHVHRGVVEVALFGVVIDAGLVGDHLDAVRVEEVAVIREGRDREEIIEPVLAMDRVRRQLTGGVAVADEDQVHAVVHGAVVDDRDRVRVEGAAAGGDHRLGFVDDAGARDREFGVRQVRQLRRVRLDAIGDPIDRGRRQRGARREPCEGRRGEGARNLALTKAMIKLLHAERSAETYEANRLAGRRLRIQNVCETPAGAGTSQQSAIRWASMLASPALMPDNHRLNRTTHLRDADAGHHRRRPTSQPP